MATLPLQIYNTISRLAKTDLDCLLDLQGWRSSQAVPLAHHLIPEIMGVASRYPVNYAPTRSYVERLHMNATASSSSFRALPTRSIREASRGPSAFSVQLPVNDMVAVILPWFLARVPSHAPGSDIGLLSKGSPSLPVPTETVDCLYGRTV